MALGPPNKRRRTDGPSLDAIAQSNAHLQLLSNRQNRWMSSGSAVDLSATENAPPAAANPGQAVNSQSLEDNTGNANAATIERATDASANNHSAPVQVQASLVVDLSPADEEEEGGSESAAAILAQFKSGRHGAQQEQQGQEQEHSVSRTSLPDVQLLPTSGPGAYEIPAQTMSSRQQRPMPPHNGLSRKSVDAAVTPGLPSPAPSEEATMSPTLAENSRTALRNIETAPPLRVMTDVGPAPLNGPASTSIHPLSAAPMTSHSPTLQRTQQTASAPNPHSRAHSASIYSGPYNLPSLQPQQQGQAAIISPQQTWQGHHRHRISQGNFLSNQPQGLILQSNAQPLRTPPVASSPHPQAQHHAQIQQQHRAQFQAQFQAPASRIPQQTLLAQLAAKRDQLEMALKGQDDGRLILLRESVEREDWFYQVLSQLFCIHGVYPRQLPQSIRELPETSWIYLGQILCPNSDINQDLLTFMSEFPEPIMDVYSDTQNWKEIYERRVSAVKLFLVQLPLKFDWMSQRCRDMQAPPLVQDMIEHLQLQSVVLQTTCFTAIARSFWGTEDDVGMNALRDIHSLDQSNFCNRGWVRTDEQKGQAYGYLRRVRTAWLEHLQKGFPASTFKVPASITQHFRMPSNPRQVQQLQTMQSAPQQQVAQGSPRLQQALISPILNTQQTQQTRQTQSGTWQHHQQQQQAQMQQRSTAISPQQATHNEQVLHQRFIQAQAQGQRQSLRPLVSAGPTPNAQANPNVAMQQYQAMMSNPPRQSPQFRPSTQQQKLRPRLVYPSLSDTPRAQPTDPVPSTSAAHQAYLRDPAFSPAVKGKPLLYQAVTGYALPPLQIGSKIAVQTASFYLSHELLKRLAKTKDPDQSGGRRLRDINEASITYRLRCCAVPQQGFTSEAVWVTADNSWPEELAFELNGVELHTRRKLHHGRYIPIDLTDHLVGGKNQLKIMLNRHQQDKRKFAYAIAVEAIGVTSHDSIRNKLRHIPATQALAAIKKSLSSSDGDVDDELAITSSNKTIKVVELFSMSKLIDIPVRGVNCLHQDAFDLETFLSQRKREEPRWPSIVDCWKCPLCQGDVRPSQLVQDDFIVEVCDELRKRGLHDLKEITVEQDGSWQPKEEERTGVRSASLEREEAGSKAASQPPKVVEIIELD